MNRMPLAVALAFALALTATTTTFAQTADQLVRKTQGNADLSGPVYDWWHGCSATSAGMLMAYYDTHGYKGKYYDLIPDGVAEYTTYGSPEYGKGQTTFHPTLLSTTAIASGDHIDDFWVGYGQSGNDPLASGRSLPADFDCIADFMGTNQDSAGNSDGATTFWGYSNGTKLSAQSIYNFGPSYYNDSGMYGTFEWLQHLGYEDPNATGTSRIFNQDIQSDVAPNGFTFDDYKNEIDNGRVVLIHVVGHTMLADGYIDDGGQQTVLINNTWSGTSSGEATMTWGGSYSGMAHDSMTVIELDENYGADAADGGSITFEYIADPTRVPTIGSSTVGMPGGALAVDDLLSVESFDPGSDGWLTLKFFYADSQLATAGITSEDDLRMYYWEDGSSQWADAGDGAFFTGAPQGGLGDFGVNLADNYVWANVDHASYWTIAQIPEPTTLALLTLAGAATLRRRRRRS